ncbi:MAG TPA: hypothetical protein VLA13_06455 [Massilibacterium sp.]|nr:hypothetical protein [Massilibacterium sp.]
MTNLTLSKLYRDIVSSLAVPEDQLRKLDVTNVINQTISETRTEFIKQGLGNEFIETETIWVTIKDVIEYPFLYKAELCKPLLRSLPIEWTVRQSVFWETENELSDKTQSWNEGDLVIKEDSVYKALEGIDSENTYDLTFEVDNVRHYEVDNGLEYDVGDVIQNSDGTYWRCTADYVNNQDETIDVTGSFEQLFWKKVDGAYQQGTPRQFSELFQLQLYDACIDNYYPFTIKENIFYTTAPNTPVTISYIPEWQYIEDFECELPIPDMMINPVRNRCIKLLASKLGIAAENLPQPQENEG